MSAVGIGILLLSLAIWGGLLWGRGQFWRSDMWLERQIDPTQNADGVTPSVCVVIPARNEAELLPKTLRSLFQQRDPGLQTIILVDDHSQDETMQVARQVASTLNDQERFYGMEAASLAPGWTGKLWAMDQGVQAAEAFAPDYLLLTDADIEHDPDNLGRLVAQATSQDLDLVSVMVRLRCESLWEQGLIPAFVFFFQKLYPFRWVNDPSHPMAAAAGGCILIRRTALQRIGGLQAIRQALIDDCALAAAVKGQGGKLWLGLSDRTRSLRPYPSLQTIWDMVARTAFTQLNYSPLLLLGTVIAMALIYLVPPLGLLLGLVTGNGAIALLGLLIWLLMALAYWPTLKFYQSSPWLAVCLPGIAFLYTLMTLDSALRHWRGQGGAWKGRVYASSSLDIK